MADKTDLISRLVAVHPTLNLRWGQTWSYRRARSLNCGEVPATVDEVIWRKGVPAALGRANPAGFQVIYLADRRDTALTEIRCTDGDVVVADFEIKPGRTIHLCPIGELAQIQRTGRGFLSGDASSSLSAMLNACNPDEARSLCITDAFLLECVSGQDDYNVSSHVARSIFDKLPHVAGVAYPSRRQFGAINFAVRVDNFWNDWGLRSVRRGRATHLACGYYQLTDVLNVTGIRRSGNFDWSSTPGPDVRELLEPLFSP